LQCLTRLQIYNVEVEPCGLDPLTALTNLAHISWAVVIPTQSGLDLALHPKLRMAPYLARWAIWDLPLAELAVEGAVLDHGDMTLIGRCRHLTRLELLECKGMAAPIVGQGQDCCPYGPDGCHDHLKCLRYGMRAEGCGDGGVSAVCIEDGKGFCMAMLSPLDDFFSKYQQAGGRGAGRTPRHKHSPTLHGVPAAAAAAAAAVRGDPIRTWTQLQSVTFTYPAKCGSLHPSGASTHPARLPLLLLLPSVVTPSAPGHSFTP
jgi:hypothetical protein